MNRFSIIWLFIILIAGCDSASQKRSEKTNDESTENQYARHFSLSEREGYTVIEIKNPWVDAQNIQYQYAVIHDSNAHVSNEIQSFKSKPNKIAAISTTHIAFLEALNELDHVVAVSDKQYIYSSRFQELDNAKNISEVGFDTNLNIEKLLQLQVKVAFVYGISNEIEPLRKKLIRAGIVPVMIGEYMEQHPLGKAEWIKVFGTVFGKKQQATQMFDSIARAYNELADKTAKLDQWPTVFTGLPWNDTWHTPGGNTYTAQLIEDAGGEYIFAGDTNSINYQYDTEIVFQRAGKAGIWLNPGTAQSLGDIAGKDERLALFQAFKNGRVYNNNKRAVRGGGSDYMESGVIKPHIILKDLIGIFHAELVEKKDFYYYRKLEKE